MTLEDMPRRVAELIAGLDPHTPAAEGEWGIVEHLCHLRDIEAEGYNVRIAQLLREREPFLRDLDGDALARDRRYREQDSAAALHDFASARARSVALLRDLDGGALAREGELENVGRITLGRLVDIMHEHDRGHLRDLERIAQMQRRSTTPVP